MRKTEADTYTYYTDCSGIDWAYKDKQMLVLFLLGFFLIIAPHLYQPKRPMEHKYSWAQEDGSNHWLIIDPPIDTSSQHGQGGLHDPKKIPAELALFFNQPLPLRTCRQEDLEMLPGIGPRKAAAIITRRQKKGHLTVPEDLLDVPGIGPATLQRILPLVSFE